MPPRGRPKKRDREDNPKEDAVVESDEEVELPDVPVVVIQQSDIIQQFRDKLAASHSERKATREKRKGAYSTQPHSCDCRPFVQLVKRDTFPR